MKVPKSIHPNRTLKSPNFGVPRTMGKSLILAPTSGLQWRLFILSQRISHRISLWFEAACKLCNVKPIACCDVESLVIDCSRHLWGSWYESYLNFRFESLDAKFRVPASDSLPLLRIRRFGIKRKVWRKFLQGIWLRISIRRRLGEELSTGKLFWKIEKSYPDPCFVVWRFCNAELEEFVRFKIEKFGAFSKALKKNLFCFSSSC